MQIAQFYGAIANGGVLRSPHVVRRIDGRLQAEPAGQRVMSAATAASLRGMLKGVLAPGGTASEVGIRGFTLAGKTGTANKIDPITHQYSQAAYVASFVGFAPADNPKLLISIMVDEPKGAIYGGQVAAPAFGKIAAFALQYQKIEPR
jgi:cell division protein FtsI/penicillin-binding protein 2